MKEHCHTKLLATRHSLFAIHYSLPFFFRLADLPISRFADKIRLGRSLALPLSRLSSCAPF
jgi:hypothetical protein